MIKENERAAGTTRVMINNTIGVKLQLIKDGRQTKYEFLKSKN